MREERKTVKQIADEIGKSKTHVHAVRKAMEAELNPFTEVRGNRVYITGEGIEKLKTAAAGDRKPKTEQKTENENRKAESEKPNFSILVSELEAKNRQIAELQEANRRQQETIDRQQEEIRAALDENRKITDRMLTLIDQGQKLQLIGLIDQGQGPQNAQNGREGVPEEAAGKSSDEMPEGQETLKKRPWWRRIFG